MTRTKRIGVLASASLIAAAGSMFIGAPQAQAVVPACMSIYQNPTTKGIQINAGPCGRTYYVKVIWAFGPDSACKAVVPYAYNYYPRPNRFARFDGANLC